MFAPLKTLLALFYLIDLISSRPPATTSPKLKLSEITQRIQQFSSGAQIPCNDTRVAQVVFTDRKRSEQELLCQAAKALLRVTKCKKDYEPFIANLQSLHGRTSCSLASENELYLRHFLPELGNFTQGMYRRLATAAARRDERSSQ